VILYKSLRRWLAPRAAIAVLAGIAAASAQTTSPSGAMQTDQYAWLEDVHGARATAWVKVENAKTLAVLQTDPNFATLYAQALAIAQARDRVPAPAFIAGQVYNFWQDDDHVRGIWRHTTAADYVGASPAWTTTLDLDELAKTESANWVWKGADCVWPAENRCLIFLSDGGEDAVTVREFDLASGAFLRDGFALTHGKQNAAWEDADTLLVSREWSPGDLTASGYPFIVKRLKRGQPLSSAVEVFRGAKSDGGYGVAPCTTVRDTPQSSSRGRSRLSRPNTTS
jgi:prolyl oligopeptidase